MVWVGVVGFFVGFLLVLSVVVGLFFMFWCVSFVCCCECVCSVCCCWVVGVGGVRGFRRS